LQLVSWVAKTCTNMSRLVANTSHPVNNHYNSNPDTFWTNQDGTAFHPGPARKLSTNLYDIYHCWVHSEETPVDVQRNCPKRVEFHAKINLWN
jgi:hypothetical protein